MAWRRGAARAAGVAAAAAAAVALALAGVPVPARADEALLPGEGDAAEGLELVAEDEPDLDPAELGVAAPGEEPTGAELAVLLDSYLDENWAETGAPGVAVAVVDAGGVRYLGLRGDVTDAHQTFVIGSLSKSLCALAVMQLVEEGLVDLDAPVARYVPEYATPASVTVRSLLNQTSGFGYFEPLADAEVGEGAGAFSYANANYDLLGRIVERVSGQEYGSYLAEHVFGPLGMGDASAGGEPACGDEAAGHRSWFGVSVADGFAHAEGDDAWGTAASGYVRASVLDMAAYLGMYLNSGAGVLSEEGIRQMVYARVPDPFGDTYYGMGWTTYDWDDGELVMSHDGQAENYVARMCVLPARGLAVVVLADANDEFGGNEAFFQLADDVTSLSVGGGAWGVDGDVRVWSHVVYNAVYLLAVMAAAAPLAGVARGHWRRHCERAAGRGRAAWAELAVPAALVHVAVPLYLLGLPEGLSGMRWRDFAAFYPDQALVLVACVVLLAAGGAAKLAVVVRCRLTAAACA